MVIISMVVLCNASVITEYDRRRSGLPNAPVDMEYDSNRTEIWRPQINHQSSIKIHVPS